MGVIQGACQIYVTIGLTLATGALPLPPGDPPALTRRERQCLFWMCMGKHDVDTAKIPGISPHTVRGYLDATKLKLGVETRPELSLKALASGLLVPDRGGMFYAPAETIETLPTLADVLERQAPALWRTSHKPLKTEE
jgi:DNA-binding CsgD family transcriptional regulator